MRPIFWIVGVPLLLVGAFFAIANRDFVTVELWPIAGRVTLPLFAALVGALYTGFLIGAVIAWWSGRRGRRALRETKRRIAELEAETARLQHRIDQQAATATSLNRSLPAA